jgi:hypothetical protein
MFFFFYLLILDLTSADDPLRDFCRLHGHQTAVVDRKLYIDGGFANWAPLSADPVNYTSEPSLQVQWCQTDTCGRHMAQGCRL